MTGSSITVQWKTIKSKRKRLKIHIAWNEMSTFCYEKEVRLKEYSRVSPRDKLESYQGQRKRGGGGKEKEQREVT